MPSEEQVRAAAEAIHNRWCEVLFSKASDQQIAEAEGEARAALEAADGVGKRWRHVKRGTVYTEIGRATFQIAGDTAIADETPVVVYQGDDGRLWARPVYEFEDGRFVPSSPVAGADDGR